MKNRLTNRAESGFVYCTHGRLKMLPAKPGDIIYRPEALQFCWVITKVEIYEDEIVFIDDSDNIFRPDDIGKTVFLTREAAEKALGGGQG